MDRIPFLSSITLPSLISLLVPIAYLTILVGSLATFSHLHRTRKITSKLRLAPYFSTHTARNVYLTLLHQSDTQPDTKVPQSILMAALQERAIEDILRIREIQTRKGPLNTLLQRGVVGDEIWQRLLRAEQELEEELKDVVAEANALAAGWGQHIFQSANEIVVNRMTKQKIEEKRAGLAAEKASWEAKREASRLELEGESTTGKSVTPVAPSATSTSASTPEKAKTIPRPATAVVEDGDEDGVMVETPASETTTPMLETPGANTASAGGGKNKKKKSKK